MVVLVIEDSSTMRQLVCHAVQRIQGAVVIEATDGVDAIAKLAEIHPDVIVTDINMPEMDGFAFITRLRQRPDHRSTPVIILTTEGADEDRRRAHELGVSAYVTKPIQHQDVVAAIASVAGARPVAGVASASADVVVLHVDYDAADDLIRDYEESLSHGERHQQPAHASGRHQHPLGARLPRAGPADPPRRCGAIVAFR